MTVPRNIRNQAQDLLCPGRVDAGGNDLFVSDPVNHAGERPRNGQDTLAVDRLLPHNKNE